MKEHELIKQIQNKTLGFDVALEQYHDCIWKYINKYTIKGLEDDDLYSILSMELYNAINNYNSDMGSKFITYLMNCFNNKLSNEIVYSKRSGHGAEHYAKAFRLDEVIPESEDGRTYGELILTTNKTTEEIESNSLTHLLYNAMNILDGESREVFEQHYFGGITAVELGKKYGFTPAGISYKLKRDLKKLRKHLIAQGITSAYY